MYRCLWYRGVPLRPATRRVILPRTVSIRSGVTAINRLFSTAAAQPDAAAAPVRAGRDGSLFEPATEHAAVAVPKKETSMDRNKRRRAAQKLEARSERERLAAAAAAGVAPAPASARASDSTAAGSASGTGAGAAAASIDGLLGAAALPTHCRGCGVTFQTEYEHKPGFIPPHRLKPYEPFVAPSTLEANAPRVDVRLAAGITQALIKAKSGTATQPQSHAQTDGVASPMPAAPTPDANTTRSPTGVNSANADDTSAAADDAATPAPIAPVSTEVERLEALQTALREQKLARDAFVTSKREARVEHTLGTTGMVPAAAATASDAAGTTASAAVFDPARLAALAGSKNALNPKSIANNLDAASAGATPATATVDELLASRELHVHGASTFTIDWRQRKATIKAMRQADKDAAVAAGSADPLADENVPLSAEVLAAIPIEAVGPDGKPLTREQIATAILPPPAPASKRKLTLTAATAAAAHAIDAKAEIDDDIDPDADAEPDDGDDAELLAAAGGVGPEADFGIEDGMEDGFDLDAYRKQQKLVASATATTTSAATAATTTADTAGSVETSEPASEAMPEPEAAATTSTDNPNAPPPDPSAPVLDPPKRVPKATVCQRCYQLTHYGASRGNMQVVPAGDFRALLASRFFEKGGKRAVILKLVDVFDFHGSVIPDFQSIVGADNPIILVVNKLDLLPAGVGENRLRHWIKTEAAKFKLPFDSLQLVSSATGHGIDGLITRALSYARPSERVHRDLYVVGSTNVGKSTLINRLISSGYLHAEGTLSTTSSMPGTTMDMIAFPVAAKRALSSTLYDTPGVVNPSQLTTHLQFGEVARVVPTKRLKPVTYRINPGQSMLLGGGLARIDLMSSRAVLFTAVCAPDVTIHVTKTAFADRKLESNAGTLLTPPYSHKRYKQLTWQPTDAGRTFETRGSGWHESCADIVFPGLGWIAITGSSTAPAPDRASLTAAAAASADERSKRNQAPIVVRAFVAGGADVQSNVSIRSPLMPYEAMESSKKWAGVHHLH